MSAADRYSVNHPHIIHEIIQGEAILVNLETGSYFSSDAVGAEIWDLIQAGMPASKIVTTLRSAYDAPSGEIETAVTSLIAQLETEGLIHLDTTLPQNAASVTNAATATTEGTAKKPFVAPVLRKYTDIEDLLLLDPIHDVDDSGWPNRPTESK